MTLSDFSIKNSVFAWMLMAGLVLFGGISFFRLGVSQMPDVDFPIVTIQLKYDGAAPEVMELDVVDIIEDAVMSVQGIRAVTSSSKEESANVTIEFELTRNIDDALQEVQSKIAQAQQRLPQGMDTPIITKANPEDFPIMWVSLSGDIALRDLMIYTRDQMKNELQTVDGVGDIWFGGYVAPILRIWVDPKKLAQYELTVGDVIAAIGSEHVETPAGLVEGGGREYNLRVIGEALTPEAFANILIQNRGSGGPIYQPIRLGDVARVVPALDDIRRISRTNLKPAVGLGIRKQNGSNSVAVARAVKARLEEVKKTLPKGLFLQVNYDGTKFIEESTKELNFTLLLSAVLTGIVCLFFLGSLRSAFNILLAIPTSIVGTFIVLYFLGFTLNTFTLLGLILAIGIVVDDAIMVLENIVRHQEAGKNRLQAAIDGAREITPAAIATTIAIIAIFIPVVFMGGIMGKFLFQFGVTMAVAVSLSLLEALTLTPMRASRFVSIASHDNAFARRVESVFSGLAAGYAKILRVFLHHRWKVIFLSLFVFVASFSLLPRIKKELVPSQDQGSFMIRMQTPLGSSIHFTDEAVKDAEKILLTHPEILRYYVAVGGFDGGEVNAAMMFVTMKPKNERPIDPKTGRWTSQSESMAALREQLKSLPELTVFLQDLSLSAFSAQRGGSMPIEFSIRGPEWGTLTQVSQKFVAEMKSSGIFQDTDTNYKFGIPEIRIVPDRDEAARRGVSVADIGTTVNTLVGGAIVGKFSEGGHRNDVRIRMEESELDPQDVIGGISVRNYRGELVPLADVVKVENRDTLQSITREDRERAVGMSSNIVAGHSQEDALKKVSEIAEKTLPRDYRVVFSGSAQVFKESFQNFVFVLWLGLIVAYMVLASQYDSFIHPIIVLLALPFSLSGAWVALWLTGLSLNMFSFIGVVLLMGIAKKNSILLVDFTNQRRREGLPVGDALMEACPKRLRPVLMTTFATMAAAVPAALSLGPGSENQAPMAVVVLGGVAVSTLLTLFVVPCAYSLASRLEIKKVPMAESAHIS